MSEAGMDCCLISNLSSKMLNNRPVKQGWPISSLPLVSALASRVSTGKWG